MPLRPNAHKALLATTTITTAVTAVTSTPWTPNGPVDALTVISNFFRGGGGTTLDIWVQTSFDGVTWQDMGNFHVTTSSLVQGFTISRYAGQSTVTTLVDGALANNTTVQGILGTSFRVKYTSTGTYSGSTTITIDALASAMQG